MSLGLLIAVVVGTAVIVAGVAYVDHELRLYGGHIRRMVEITKRLHAAYAATDVDERPRLPRAAARPLPPRRHYRPATPHRGQL